MAGPILSSAGKRWIRVFTCHATRACYLDLVTDLSAEAFLRAFRRFTARYSVPDTVVFDNGTNFVSASKLVRNDSPTREWTFNPSASPHFDGVHEVILKLMKKALLKSIGSSGSVMEDC